MRLSSWPLCKVVRVVEGHTKYNRPGEGCYIFTLECGHKCYAKRSEGLPKRKRCWVCGTNHPCSASAQDAESPA